MPGILRVLRKTTQSGSQGSCQLYRNCNSKPHIRSRSAAHSTAAVDCKHLEHNVQHKSFRRQQAIKQPRKFYTELEFISDHRGLVVTTTVSNSTLLNEVYRGCSQCFQAPAKIVPLIRKSAFSSIMSNWHAAIILPYNAIYRVIYKSLRDFRTRLRNNQDRHGRKEHINRYRISQSFFLY